MLYKIRSVHLNPPAYRPGLCYSLNGFCIIEKSQSLWSPWTNILIMPFSCIMAIIMSKVHNMFYFQSASLLPECVGVFTIRSLRSHSHHAIGHAATWMATKKAPPFTRTSPYSKCASWWHANFWWNWRYVIWVLLSKLLQVELQLLHTKTYF